jgi:hypothetical protein
MEKDERKTGMRRKSWNILKTALVKTKRNRRRNFRYTHFLRKNKIEDKSFTEESKNSL